MLEVLCGDAHQGEYRRVRLIETSAPHRMRGGE